MATISTNHSTLPGGYYTDNHHTDPTGVAASDVSAAKVDRFYIELDGTPGGGGQMIATGSMTFTDGGTIESNATVDAEMNDWGGGYSFDPSAGHLEIMTDDGLGDMSLTVGAVTTNTPGDAAAALDPNDVSLAYGYVQLVGIVFDGDESAGTKSASVVGYYVPVSVNGVEHHLFFPTADQDLSNVSLPDGSGTRSTITHQDSLADGDGSTIGTFISYVDLLDADAVSTGGSSDLVVSGTGSDDLIDSTYTDTDGDKVDNDDGNPNEVDGDNDSIVAGAGNDTVLSGAGNDTVDAGDGDDEVDGGAGNDELVGGAGEDTLCGGDGNDTIYGDEGDGGIDPNATLADGTFYAYSYVSGTTTNIGPDNTGANSTSWDLTGDNYVFSNTNVPGSSGWPIVYVGDDLLDQNGETWTLTSSRHYDHNFDYIETADGSVVEFYYDAIDQRTYSEGPQFIQFTATNAAGDTVQFFYIENSAASSSTNISQEVLDFYDAVQAGGGIAKVVGPTTSQSLYNYDGINTSADGEFVGDLSGGGAGNANNDSLKGDAGDDVIYGQQGADTIEGGTGADTVDGGSGDDDIQVGAGDVATGGTGDDEFTVDPSDVDGAAISIDGGTDGTDGAADDTANGDEGDILNLSAATTGVDITFGTDPEDGTVNGLDTDSDNDITFAEIEKVIATDEDDTIDGSAATTGINVDAGAGDDDIIGGTGDDTIDGGNGADTIAGGVGDDAINLGDQDGIADVVTLTDGDGDDTLTGVDGPVDSGNGTYTGTDTLDVAGLTDPVTGDPVTTDLVTITTDPTTGTVITFPDGTSVNLPELQAPSTDPTDPGTESWLNALGIPSRDPNYIVEGTDAGDLIDVNYADDPNGDMVDNNDGNPINPDAAGGDNDSIVAGAGNDTVLAGAGDDDILFGADDSVYGGSWDDVFTLDLDNLDGNYTRIDGGSDGTDGSPDDASNGDDGDILDLSNALSGASITYMVDPELGNINGIDTDTGSDISFIEIEKIIATDHADSVDGQFATSGILLDMAAGDDSFAGGSGDDTVNAGSGDDTIDGADGDDSLTGGDGNDTFVFDETGDDTISDFGVGNSGSQDDGDQSNNDFIDLEDYYTDIFELRADFEDDGLLNQSVGDFSDNTAFTGSLTLTGLSKTDLTFDTTNVVCFTRGTMIKTIDGERAIEDLRQGDLVWTKDDGFQPIQWIGSKALDQATLEAAPKLRPVRIKAGAMGRGLPKRDLIVSPQHRVLVNSKIVQRMTKEDEVLVSATHLLQINGVDYLDADGVEYFHFLFDKHQIVLAEGAESESLFTGPEALAAVEPEAREEILEIFPELASMDYDATITAVRPILSGRQSRKLTVRHVQNRKALLM